MIRKLAFRLTAGAALLAVATAASAAALTTYKSPSCGCCAKWVEHMQRHGHQVKVVNVEDIMAVKAKAGIPDALASCHTTMVGGYVVEGHVPAEDVARLLKAKPKAKGIAVAGMPMGAPGMEHGNHRVPFQTMLIKPDGSTAVFARH